VTAAAPSAETRTGPDPDPGPARLTLAVILASATLTVMAGAIIGPLGPQTQLGVGVSGSLAGLVVTIHGAVTVVASPLAGALVARS